MIDLSGYSFDKLREDSEFIVSRGSRAGDSGSVLMLAAASEHSTPSSLERIKHVYSLKDELDSGWATRPLDLTDRHGIPALVLDDPGGDFMDGVIGRPLALREFLRLAIGLAKSLGCLHGRGLIHRDIKPANVIVNVATGEARLTGFGLTSRLPRQRQLPEPPEVISGTLAYMAPEQTGRMNRSVDSRSDLYSLGITFYEMFVGGLPFTASEPMEWVHCHIARRPPAPKLRRSEIPEPLSAIILKLLAKAPEERYQTAAGVEADLRRCFSNLETNGSIESFPLGARDVPDRLLIPEKLYGREKEVEMLLAAFDRVVGESRTELVLVSGYSGIGKSSIVHELHKALIPKRGLFASGKFDQYKRDIPYATLAQAFQTLVRQVLGQSDAEVDRWRQALHEALGPNGQLMVNLIPEIELIIGKQQPVSDLPPQEAHDRFQTLFRRFLGVFGRPEHPLALFLDDLQWLDAATLKLLEHLTTSSEVRHVLFIGAYRDNEVGLTHPLTRALGAMNESGVKVQQIVLRPLTPTDVSRLISDLLQCEQERADPLAQLVFEKTDGNPFFAIQFIEELEEEGLLAFAPDVAVWKWDVDRIRVKDYSENVVDLMVGKLNRFPETTQDSLKLLACLGNSAEFEMIQLVYQDLSEKMHEQLWEAVRVGLIFRSENSYRFLHDRVQEAAYSLIPEAQRAETHLRIGRLLATHTPLEKREEAIFEIVNQLNRGTALIRLQEEREQLAEFNLIAGKRAKASTAYVSALSYLVAGTALLSDDGWERRPDLMLALELHRAECEFLTGDLGAAETRLMTLSSYANNPVDRAAVACLRSDLYTTLDRNDRAVEVCLTCLRHLGIDWSAHPTDEEVRREYERTWVLLGNREIEELIDLPVMNEPTSVAALEILARTMSAAVFMDINLFSLILWRTINLSLEHGNADASSYAFVHVGTIAGPRFGNYKAGFRFGRLGYNLVEQRGLKRYQARTYLAFGVFIVSWTKHLRMASDLIRQALDVANTAGDLQYVAFSWHNLIGNLLATGDPLADVQCEAEHGLGFVQKSRFGLVTDNITAQLALIRTLRGLTATFGCFNDAQFEELQFERRLSSDARLAFAECWYWTRKLQARYFAGDYAEAVDASLNAQRLLWTSPSFIESAEAHFYGALSHAACCDAAFPVQYRQHVEALTGHHKQLVEWAENCPENFENRANLVAAEIARIEGRELDAERLYEAAITSARENGFVHHEALANELAARFYGVRGFTKISRVYLRDARNCYLRWGADGKVRQLDKSYPHLGEEKPALGPTTTIGTPVEHLDLATVIKVSQAVSSEIELDKLMDILMRTAIAQAGAERGLLILPQGDQLRIEAEATTTGDSVTVHLRKASVTAAELPDSIVHYVVRTRENVILDDASSQNPFSSDAHIRQHHVRSILCLPLLKQAKLIGVLYLENNLTLGVFTPARVAVLKMLASEAAISLENTRLYGEIKSREARIRRLVEANIMGIVIWDLDGRVIDANDSYLHLVDHSREELVSGRVCWRDLTPLEWRDRDEQAVAEIKATGAFRPFEKEFFRKDGTRVPVLIGGAIFEANGTEGVAFILDLREQKRAESALGRAQTELAHVSRVATLGELTASIAHEVNQPLTAVANNANACLSLLPKSFPDFEEVQCALTEIIDDADRASAIMARIRQWARKEQGERVLLDLREVITDLLTIARRECANNQITIHTNISEDMPLVLGDRVQLQQVLLNLVTNGIDSMNTIDPSKRVLHICGHRKSSDKQTEAVISVEDAGTGFKAEEMNRLFEAFYTTKAQGMGMGLPISRSIIESHDGRLWAELNEGSGTTFFFSLPAAGEGTS